MRKFKVAYYIKLNLDIMTVLGYLEPKDMGREKKILYKFYSVLVTVVFCILEILSCFKQMFLESDIEKATNILFVLLAKVTLLVKVFSIQMNQKKIFEIIYKKRPDFYPDDEDQRKMFEKAADIQKKLTIIFHSMGIMATLTMCFFPLFDAGMSGKLPFSAWYPFEVKGAPIYLTMLAYQTVCHIFMSLAHVATDLLISGFLMAASNQLVILRYQIVNIKNVAIMCSEDGVKEDLHSGMLRGLVQCIKHYNSIIEFADEVKAIFSVPLFFLFFLGVGAVGLTLFQFILIPIMTVEFFSRAVFQACVILEIFLYCFYGNSIMVQSDALTSALYQCGWEDGSLEFKKGVNRFMIRTQKPYCWYAGNFFLMSLPNFILILKWSWSYFTLLHRIHEE